MEIISIALSIIIGIPIIGLIIGLIYYLIKSFLQQQNFGEAYIIWIILSSIVIGLLTGNIFAIITLFIISSLIFWEIKKLVFPEKYSQEGFCKRCRHLTPIIYYSKEPKKEFYCPSCKQELKNEGKLKLDKWDIFEMNITKKIKTFKSFFKNLL